jgi:hypothetical protein
VSYDIGRNIDSDNLCACCCKEIGSIAFAAGNVQDAFPVGEGDGDGITVQMLVKYLTATCRNKPLAGPGKFVYSLVLHASKTSSLLKTPLQGSLNCLSGGD